MKVINIKRMWWGSPEKTSVGLVADLENEPNVRIGTPYDETSIVWNSIKDFPIHKIEDMDPEIIENMPIIVRDHRNKLLQDSDWTQVLDTPVSNREAWAVYRQNLRDITQQPGFPFEIMWPQKPE